MGKNRRGLSDSEVKKSIKLKVCEVGLSDESTGSQVRPHSALDSKRPTSSSSTESQSESLPEGIKAFSKRIKNPDTTDHGEQLLNVAAQPQDFRPSVRSVAAHDWLKTIFQRWYRFAADKKASMVNKLLSPQLRKELLRSGIEGLRAGKRVEVAVLFCDIRNFTSITELNEPEDIMGMLNEYFGAIVKIISKNGGVVDKFIGDAVLAEYFIDQEDLDEEEDVAVIKNKVCENAVQSALEIIEFTRKFDVGKFNLKDDEDHHYINENRLQNGIGISFGNVIFGALGSDDRYELTIIGDEVNLASRLQDLNKNPEIAKRLECPIVISQKVYDLLPRDKYACNFFSLGEQHIKGKKNLVNAFGYGKVRLDAAQTASVVTANRHFHKKIRV
jgi:class 3 adenylate cyclase